MPELPEVEVIANTLRPLVEKEYIQDFIVYNPKTVCGGVPLDHILGMRIGSPSRRGKLLILPLVGKGGEHKYILFFHLKMTGRVVVHLDTSEPGKHTRVIIKMSSRKSLFFDDARKFGYLRIESKETVKKWSFWGTLGPEPFGIDEDTFVALFQQKKGSIKSLLLNQKILAGCGNIYADESLFRAKIKPSTQGCQLSTTDLKRLFVSLKAVLLESINACGSSIKDYRTANGDVGAFQNFFCVYGRKGKLCISCGSALESEKVVGRTTVWCPGCQIY